MSFDLKEVTIRKMSSTAEPSTVTPTKEETTPTPTLSTATPSTQPAGKKGKSPSQIQYERKQDYPEGVTRVSRKDTGNAKQRVAVLFGYVGTGYYGLQWDESGLPSMLLFKK